MFPQQRSWHLTETVVELAEQAAVSADPALAIAGRRATDRLRQPLCVAVVGRVSAGKSTLLNALLGTAISPTAGGECTKVVYVFRHGRWDFAVAHPRDGSAPVPVSLDGTQLPTTMPLPAAALRCVDVTLSVPMLEQSTLVDTPGMASTSSETSAITARLLADTGDAAAAADALLFCINGPIKDDEAEAVRSFRSGRGGTRLTGGTAVGVLTKADQLSSDRRTAWKTAIDLARRMSTSHADLFSAVVPVIGLLAQTATTGAMRECHARALVTLAKAWNSEESDTALLDARLFCSQSGPIAADERQQLVDLLGLFGIGEMLDAIRAGRPAHAAALTALARAASGFDDMRSRLEAALGSRADVLKAAAALEELMDCAHAASNHKIYDEAQQLLDLPDMFPLRVLEIAQQLAKGRVRPPAGLAEEAWTVVTTGLPTATAQQAARGATAWREWAMLADSAGRYLARVMVRAWQLAASERTSTHE